MNKIVSGIMLTLLLTIILPSTFITQPVKATAGTIYIRADGSVDPPTAPIQRDEDIYTLTDKINDSIVVERSNIIIDGAGYTLQGTGSGNGFYLSGIKNVTIMYVEITAFNDGIRLDYSSNNIISENNITNNNMGILLWSFSDSNTISDNNCSNNEQCGIYLWRSPNNNIINNDISNNGDGIRLFDSSDTYIADNNLNSNSGWGIMLKVSSNIEISDNKLLNSGIWLLGDVSSQKLSYFNTHIIENNTLNGKLIYYYKDTSGIRVPEDAGSVILANCDNVTVENVNASFGSVGIELAYTENSKISNNEVLNNLQGIYLHYSSYNNITNNNAPNNVVGINPYHSSSNHISDNNFSNSYFGIRLGYSTHNNIIHNVISNSSYGLYISHSSNNNKIYHNNFVNNTNQVYTENSVNIWDDGYPSGGNYWSDYTDVDLYSGPYQNETGSDGIWDHPYVIDADNQDRYPLVNPWTPTPAWPMFLHDPQHTGRSPFVGPRISPEARVLVEGERDDDYLFLPTVIGSDGMLYFGARITEGGVTKEGLYAFNPDGTEKWFYGQSNPRGAPALFEGESIVYILSYGVEFGGISAVNAKTGNLKWRKSFASLYGDQNPVIGDNGILYFIAGYILPDESYDSCLFALDKNGEAVWVYAINRGETYFDLQLPDEGSAGGAFPGPASALTIDKEGTIYFGYNDTLFALNPNGTEKWRKAFNVTQVLHPNIGTPSIGADGTVYVPVERTREDPRGRGNTGSLYGVNPNGTVKWERGVGYGIGIPLIGPDGSAYIDYITYPVDSPIHHVMALDPEGFANWHLSSYDSMIPRAVDAEGTICITEEKVLRAVNPDGSEKWRWVASDDLGWLSIGVNGTLYIPSRSKLYAIRDLLPPDFSITASPISLSIQQGGSDISTITITSIRGFNQPVQLTVSGAPSGITTTLSPEQVTPPPDGSTTSTLTVSVDTTATPGSYTLTVTGTNGTLTYGVDIPLEITTLAIFKPKLSIPVYAPTYQKAHKGTILTFIINVTNSGTATDTIELDPSGTLNWKIQLSQTSAKDLEPHQSTEVFLNVTVGEAKDSIQVDTITINGISQGDTSETSSCQVKVEKFEEGEGLLNAQLKFKNTDTVGHTLYFDVPDYVKLSSKEIFLNPSKAELLNIVFDPKRYDIYTESGLNSFSIHVVDISDRPPQAATIPIKFDEYVITTTDFDLTEDSYKFQNGYYSINTCYGMSETSILYFKKEIPIPEGKPCAYELTEPEAEEKIRHHQDSLTQHLMALRLLLPDTPNEEAEYKKLKENIEEGNPMVLALQFLEGKKVFHAVVAYKIVEKGNTAYILIYENELPYYDLSGFNAFRYATYNLITHEMYYWGSKVEFLVHEAERNIITITESLVTSPALKLIFDCPVNITIIDQYGRVISDNGTNQIPNATVASTDETKFFYLPLDLTYNVSISAYNTGNFTLTIITPIANNTVAGIIYENIPVTYTTKATLEIVPNQIAQIMKIDNDGDDVIDEEKNPDVSETISISPPPLSASISPLSASITVGESLTFTSTVSGGYTPYSYQWYLNGAPVSGTTSASWTFTPTTSGIYYIYLKVTDDIGNTTQSETARITVTTVPVGGYSVPIQLPATAQPATIHIALLTILTAIFITIKRKTKRKH